ncbi:MAG TPA: alpha/beta hydrolase [Pyrinomonadaceae bacterium]|nr:alpha/beta hydrolase [Pyrinomonadaceae bacterium]
MDGRLAGETSLTTSEPLSPAANKGRRARVRRAAVRILAALSVLTVALLLAGAVYQFGATQLDARAYTAPGRMVDVGGYRLHLYCTGEGARTVILESGLGGGVLDWGSVQPEVARFARVCSYDRAGAGWSEAGPAPRDSRQVVRELHALLGTAGLRPPYVLVGHSLGGLHAQLFASQYPEEVAGVVLVDSTHEGQTARKELPAPSPYYPLLLKAAAPVGVARIFLKFNRPSEHIPEALAPEWAAVYSHTGHLYSGADELLNIQQSMRELRESPMRLDGKPLVVLTRGEWPPASSGEEAERAERVWRELQADLATRSTNARQVIAEKSGHYIQFDEPGLVIDAVRQVVNGAGR